MDIALVHVSGVGATARWTPKIPVGIIGAQVTFKFDDPLWEGLSKTVVFSGVVDRYVVLESDSVVIPQEVVSQIGVEVKVGIYGTDSQNNLAIPTIWANLGVTQDAANLSGELSTDNGRVIDLAQLREDVDNIPLQKGEAVGSMRSGTAAKETDDYKLGRWATAIGYQTKAAGDGACAIGMNTNAPADGAHAEGDGSSAEQVSAHAEGHQTKALGYVAHSEGYQTEASGFAAHAEGYGTKASGTAAHAEGQSTIAASDNQHVQGIFNIEDKENKYAHIVGNGTGHERSNAHTLDWEGNAWFAGSVEGAAVILVAPNGSRFRVTIDNTGTLRAAEVTG